MQKIFFVNRFFYPDRSATSQILSDLVFNFNDAAKYEVHIVTGRGTYENDRRLIAKEIINEVNVHRVWTSGFGRKHLIARFVDYFSFYFTAFFMLLKQVSKGDVVVAKTDPPVISYVVYIVCRIKRAKLINWLQDLFPEVAGKLGLIKENSLLYYLIKKVKDKTLLNAYMNVVIGYEMGEKLKGIGVPENKITVIPNWNVNENIDYVSKKDNPLVKNWGLEGKFVIGYSGNFGRAHEFESIVDLISEYKNNDDIIFIFVGGGKYYDDLKLSVKNEDINNVIFKPYQSVEMLNMSLSVADLHLISLKPELEGLIVPSKFFGLASIGANLLFIGDCSGELGSIIKKNNCGYCTAPDNLSAFMDTLIPDGLTSDLSAANKTRLKNLYLQNYLPTNAYSKWNKLLGEYLN